MGISITNTMKVYTVHQIKQLLDLLSLQLTSGLISIEEFDARKLEIMRLPRQSVAKYERHGADCVFCEEEDLAHRSDEPMLVNMSKAAEKVRGIRI